MPAPLATHREPGGIQNKSLNMLYVFEHKMLWILIHAPHTRTMAFWHIGNKPPMISQSKMCYNTPILYTAAIFVKYSYTTGSWLFCLKANIRDSAAHC